MAEPAPDLTLVPAPLWQEAERRATALRPLAALPACSRAQARAAAAALGITERQVYRLRRQRRIELDEGVLFVAIEEMRGIEARARVTTRTARRNQARRLGLRVVAEPNPHPIEQASPWQARVIERTGSPEPFDVEEWCAWRTSRSSLSRRSYHRRLAGVGTPRPHARPVVDRPSPRRNRPGVARHRPSVRAGADQAAQPVDRWADQQRQEHDRREVSAPAFADAEPVRRARGRTAPGDADADGASIWRFCASILGALNAPIAFNVPGERLERQALDLLRTVGVRVLIVDELQNLLAGTQRRRAECLNMLRFLGKSTKRSTACRRWRKEGGVEGETLEQGALLDLPRPRHLYRSLPP